jgi:hypothetical protein
MRTFHIYAPRLVSDINYLRKNDPIEGQWAASFDLARIGYALKIISSIGEI